MKTTKIMMLMSLLTVSAITLPVDKHAKPSEQKVKPGDTGVVQSLINGAATSTIAAFKGPYNVVKSQIALAAQQIASPINTILDYSHHVIDFYTTGEGRELINSYSASEKAAFTLGNTLMSVGFIYSIADLKINPFYKAAILTTLVPALTGSFATLLTASQDVSNALPAPE